MNDSPGFRAYYPEYLQIIIACLSVFAVIYLAYTLWLLARKTTTKKIKITLLVSWIIIPPLWFYAEYFLIFIPHGLTGTFEFFKYGQDVASKLWAAVVATISLSLYKTSLSLYKTDE